LSADAGVDLLSRFAGLALQTLLLQRSHFRRGDSGGLSGFGLGSRFCEGLTFGDAGLANGFKFCGPALFAMHEVGVGNSRLGFEFLEQSLFGRGCRFQAVGEFRFF